MSEETNEIELDPIYFTYYQIESSLGSRENDRYCVEIKAEIKIIEPGNCIDLIILKYENNKNNYSTSKFYLICFL
jgi:hypothetical protein